MRNFQDTFETRKRSFISAFSNYMTITFKADLNCHSENIAYGRVLCNI